MRITCILNRQHIGFMFKKHWHVVQGKRNVPETNAAAILLAQQINVGDPKEYLNKINQKPKTQLKFENIFKTQPFDEHHPDYNQKEVYLYGDSNLLVSGIPQAQVLVNTQVFAELPEKYEELLTSQKIPSDVERSMQQSVLVSHLLDAEQKKTAKIVSPLRPMRPFPRNYGITDTRKNLLLSARLLSHCERFQGHLKSADRQIINNAFFVIPFEKNDCRIQLELTAETFMTSRKPINPFIVDKKSDSNIIPDIFPVSQTASLSKVHFYERKNAYPVKPTNQFSHPHTIMLHYSNLDVKNLFETSATSDQFESRAILKGFAAAAGRAQSLYGVDAKILKSPIVVQVVHLDSKRIQFGVYQLNTLDLNGTNNVKNYWFSQPPMNLYENCRYDDGRPSLTSYNFDVFRMMNVFYNN